MVILLVDFSGDTWYYTMGFENTVVSWTKETLGVVLHN